MPRSKNNNLNQFKTELAHGIKSLREAQDYIRELRNAGVNEAELRKTMVVIGFGNVTADQFMAAKTIEDVTRLLEPLTRLDSN